MALLVSLVDMAPMTCSQHENSADGQPDSPSWRSDFNFLKASRRSLSCNPVEGDQLPIMLNTSYWIAIMIFIQAACLSLILSLPMIRMMSLTVRVHVFLKVSHHLRHSLEWMWP
nr:hypothetical protein [Marinospirillum sp.]